MTSLSLSLSLFLCLVLQSHGTYCYLHPYCIRKTFPYIITFKTITGNINKCILGTSLVIQWRRLHAPKAGDVGCIPGQGTRSHILQLSSHATAKDQRSCMWQLRSGAGKYFCIFFKKFIPITLFNILVTYRRASLVI